MKTAAQQMGRKAEELAIRYFTRQGFAIMARNYRYQRAEIDIIAKKNHLLVFVEVKARSNDQFGHPEAFVTPKQQALVRAAAEHYIIAQDWNYAIRFDIIAILQQNSNHPQLTHFEDAF